MVRTELLAFDQHNPRFTPNKRPVGITDEDIIRFIDRTADLGELIESMAANGYIKVEPMIVWENSNRLVVLEGNRRLAALKCFKDAALAQRVGLNLPKISESNRATLNDVPVWRVEDRASAQDLKQLRTVLGSRAATNQLVVTGRLDDAAITATPRSELFAQCVYEAEHGLTAALQYQSGFDANAQSEPIDTLKLIQSNADSLVLIVQKKATHKSDQKQYSDD